MIQRTKMIGIGELAVSAGGMVNLKTMALGSCVAVIMLDPKIRAIGMAHIALPDSSIDPVKALALPGYFADTAVPALLAEMTKAGCDARGRGYIIKLAGGSSIMDVEGVFNIGKRNVLAIRKILWQLKLGAVSEDVGGDISRTIEVDQEKGLVKLSNPVKGIWEI